MNMSINTSNKDYRTLGYVIRRTNYGEADRILNLITPLGKKTVIAKGVRKSKSKLAGNIELFALTDFNVHQGKSEFGVVTGAKMIKFYKEIGKLAESSDNPEYFEIIDQGLYEINNGTDLRLVEAWFLLNAGRASGEELNLYRDITGEALREDKKYNYNVNEEAFTENSSGNYSANEIKMLRLCEKAKLKVVKKVKFDDNLIEKVLFLARTVNR